ncbi:hypothetical protein E6O75_ATG08021 [Venturia nashicola]|uniref:Uncharacterized protein n=1 Tax=Venturia nashicola TaxID=86259 RepID=A0A4Z1NLV3_9PEZI|nr:hypothetical protein E6O75_ATG08021 [Venturia nashicola]
MADLNKFGAIQTDDMFVENTSKRLCTPFLFANIGKMGNVRSLYKKGRKTNFIAYNSTLPLQSSISWSTQHMRTPNIDGSFSYEDETYYSRKDKHSEFGWLWEESIFAGQQPSPRTHSPKPPMLFS